MAIVETTTADFWIDPSCPWSAMALGGSDVGSPILAVLDAAGDQVGFYGPIIAGPLAGEAAMRLWDAYLTMATTPGLFELKHARDEELQFS